MLEFIVETLFIDVLGGATSRINNVVLRLRGKETKSVEDIKLDKIRKRYEYKSVKLKRQFEDLSKGVKGVVLEVIDMHSCFIEIGESEKKIRKVKLKDLSIRK